MIWIWICRFMRIWQPQTGAHKNIFFFKKISFWLSSKSSQNLRLLGQLFLCIHVDLHWNFHQEITVARIFGHGEEPPELLRPFSRAGTWSKLRQIGGKSRICCKRTRFSGFFPIIFDVPSFFRIFFVFFPIVFYVCFRFLSAFFFRFWTKLEKSQKRKKPRFFSFFYRFFIVFLSFFFVFLSFFYRLYFRPENAFSNYFRIIFDSQTQFSSNFRLIFDLKTDFTELEAHFDFAFAITGAFATVIVPTLAGLIATS